MSTSHHRDGTDSILLSGPLPGTPLCDLTCTDGAAFFANDNHAPLALFRPGNARAILLCQEHDADGLAILAIRILMADGETTVLETADNAQEIIALWRAAGAGMNLPLALRDAGGTISYFTQRPGEASFHRRGGSALSGRRPRVMRRRQPPLKAFVFKRKTRKA